MNIQEVFSVHFPVSKNTTAQPDCLFSLLRILVSGRPSPYMVAVDVGSWPSDIWRFKDR